MSSSLTPPSPALQAHIHQLWDQLAAFPAARVDDALQHLLATVANLTDSQNAYWMGTIRLSDTNADPLFGWRPRALRYLRPLPSDEHFTARRLHAIKQGQVDESLVAQARLAGAFRAHRLRDIVSPAWFETEHYRHYLARGIHDSLSVVLPVNVTAEAYYGFLRMRPDDPFTDVQRHTAAYALRGLPMFHRQVMLAYGVGVAETPLTPVERKVISLLLTDKSEKEIAAILQVTLSSVHTYISGVFHKLGVHGRSGLTALWLGQPHT